MKAYIIIAGLGEYSDRESWPAKVYMDKGRAEAAMVALELVENKYRDIWVQQIALRGYESYSAIRKELEPVCVAEYLSLGFDANMDHDWELAEADMDEPTPL